LKKLHFQYLIFNSLNMYGTAFAKKYNIRSRHFVIWLAIVGITVSLIFLSNRNIYKWYSDSEPDLDRKRNFKVVSAARVAGKTTTIAKNLESRAPLSVIPAARMAIAAINSTRSPIPSESRSTPSVISAEKTTAEPVKAKSIPKIKPQISITSHISLNETTNTVVKKITRYADFDILKREVCVLKLLQRFP